MEVKSYVKYDTTLSSCHSEFENWDEYVDYLNKQINVDDYKFTYNSDKFGQINGLYYTDYALSDNNGEYEIHIKLNTDKEIDEDEWYEHIDEDKNLIDCLKTNFEQYIDQINKNINTIKFPKDEILIYHDNYLYMQISTINPLHTPEFISLQVDKYGKNSNFEEQFIDNLYVVS